MDRYFNNLDLVNIFNIIIDEKDYEELVVIDNKRGNLLDNPIYKQTDEQLKIKYDNAISKGLTGDFWEQSDKGNTFRHIAVNRKFGEKNRFRLYLCPEDHNLYPIVNEALKRASRNNLPIYLKYSRENRYDKILFYARTPQDLLIITNLLEGIKKDNPSWFTNMKKSDTWLSESKFKGAYIAPEKITKRDFNVDYPSYTKAFEAMLLNIRNELFFHFQVNSIAEMKKYSKQEVFSIFCEYFKRELGKMGLFLFYNDNDELMAYCNSLFPGFGKSVDEDITLTKNGLEVGKRIDEQNKRYYIIPYGKIIPDNPDDYKKFEYYDQDDKTAMMKKFYPQLFEENYGNGGGGISHK